MTASPIQSPDAERRHALAKTIDRAMDELFRRGDMRALRGRAAAEEIADAVLAASLAPVQSQPAEGWVLVPGNLLAKLAGATGTWSGVSSMKHAALLADAATALLTAAMDGPTPSHSDPVSVKEEGQKDPTPGKA